MNHEDTRTVLLTGATSGIGAIAARKLAATGATVAAVGRDADRGRRLAEDATAENPGTVRFHRADFATQDAVRRLAADVEAEYDRLDVLAHNAGLSTRERTITDDGAELTLAVNHLAPYLLTHELLGSLRDAAPARVLVTASGVHTRGTLAFDDLRLEREYSALAAYARSKLANVAFTIELADRLDGDGSVVANCFHPGFIPSTDLFRDAAPRTRLFVRLAAAVPGIGTTAEAGADRLVELATAPEYGSRSGLYVGDDGPRDPAPAATDPELREELWRVSADLVGVDPDWP
ncbi:SDR family NAD(P)-dependent oxidoreductase [Halalkalicoccus jeotgali]|uniref:Short-chain dehydrogenase/reductase SDR n=1 Tax=Halalkalicoccus jeotgali (strain DSM 18796 / CECT 7217 / JCM 14584 / KCTC 4019 / B3) TaxID=795797 RepID=D8J7G1_HALJB|nr:SDR family NAD(P)-dependent oxidoreductase [Halalkalicoccus jeotgali]ADJ14056.1 short-chain dehydrogenase/reductase SDR [Halalkalicoccus jeotgali B3]ELY33900.1 short-chain dehydrogenase/reductase SDR [Halalkalicoccus jeotgali B3]